MSNKHSWFPNTVATAAGSPKVKVSPSALPMSDGMLYLSDILNAESALALGGQKLLPILGDIFPRFADARPPEVRYAAALSALGLPATRDCVQTLQSFDADKATGDIRILDMPPSLFVIDPETRRVLAIGAIDLDSAPTAVLTAQCEMLAEALPGLLDVEKAAEEAEEYGGDPEEYRLAGVRHDAIEDGEILLNAALRVVKDPLQLELLKAIASRPDPDRSALRDRIYEAYANPGDQDQASPPAPRG